MAIHGGKPVRDVRWRPYASARSGAHGAWLSKVGPNFRGIFLSGIEGLPQPLAREFERRWTDYCGCRHALLLPHGTDALRIALAAAFDHDGLDYGGEVIVPNLSFIASATSCLDRRFGVALVDVDQATMMLDPKRVEEAILPGKTRAIMPVHQFGHTADMTALLDIAKRYGLKVVEDAAQAHGAEWENARVGSLGDAGAFSFQSSKTLSSGEGGILTTNDESLFRRALSIYNAGRAPEGAGRWEHPHLGWNCRPTEYQAALLLHRLSCFNELQAHRTENYQMLQKLLAKGLALEPLQQHPGVTRHGMYMFPMRFRLERAERCDLQAFLEAVRAEGAPIYRLYPATIAGQPIMQELVQKRQEYIRVLPTPVADRAIGELCYIAHDVFLGSKADMADIASAIEKVSAYFSSSRR